MSLTYTGIRIDTKEFDGQSNTDDRQLSSLRRNSQRVISDTEFSYSGEWEHRRLVDRRIGAFNNTVSVGYVGAEASYWIDAANAVTLVFRQEQPCVCTLTLDGQSGTFSADGTYTCRMPALSQGAHRLTVSVTAGQAFLDALYVEGAEAAAYRIMPDNTAFVYSPLGLPNGVLPQGEHLAFWFCGATVSLIGTGEAVLSVDGHAVTQSLPFSVCDLSSDQWHCLTVTAVTDVVPSYFEIQDPTPFMTYANDRTDADLAGMAQRLDKALPQSEWHPVALPASLPQRDVTLTGGVLKRLFDRNIRYLKDSLKKPCFVDFKDQDRIWVDMLPASNDGRMLYGMGNTLRFKDIPTFRTAIDRIIEPIEHRQFTNFNGYCLPYESTNFALSTLGWPHFMRDEEKNYDRTMFTKGLIAAGFAGCETAFKVLRGLYDWFDNCEYLPILLLGAMGIQGSAAGPRVYFSPVGKPEDLAVNMNYYDMDWWLEALSARIPEAIWRFTLNRPHNYLLTSLCALFDVWRATGQQKYLDAVLGGREIYNTYFRLPGGVLTICEHFECRPETHFIANSPTNIFETCASVFMAELCARLLSAFPGTEAYAAQMEECIFNILASCQAPDGRIRYFNHMNGIKMPAMCVNTCCEIQATGLFGELPGYLYQTSADGLYVNLYAPSVIRFAVGEHPFTVETKTDFPTAGHVTVTVHTKEPARFTLRMRIPGWTSSEPSARLGDTPLVCRPGEYLTQDRVWQDGDTVTLTLPMPLRTERYHGIHDIAGYDRQCILRGPILMAVCGQPDSSLEQIPGEPVVRVNTGADTVLPLLHRRGKNRYAIVGQDGLTVKPYYEVSDGEPFSVFAAYPKDI